MSKLYDALLWHKGSIPDLDYASLIGDERDVTRVPASEPAPTTVPAPPEPEIAPVAPTVHADPAPADITAVRKIRMRLPQRSPALPFGDDHWLANEQYRILRTKLLQHIKRPQVILVSSGGSGDGKSITAINLAGVLSLRSESRVLLVDGDFRKPNVHFQLGIPESPGLADILEGRCEPLEAIVATDEFPNLFLMAAGQPIDNPAELLQSSRWPSTAAWLKKQFRYIIMDSPPIAAVADYDLLQSACDGVIVVVRPDHTSRPACKRALESVPKDKLLGVLLNCVTPWFLGGTSGYDYGAPYNYPHEAKR
jgi:capsular exopolysaccharide synthesis family protein